MKRQSLGLLISISLLSCCGYSTRSLLPSYMKTVRVRFFENRTLQPLLGETFTNSLKESFIRERMRVVNTGDAGLEVEGKIIDYKRNPYTYTGEKTITVYRMSLRIGIKVVDLVKNEVFFEKEIEDYVDQPSDEDESTWIPKLCQKVSERAVQEIVTHW